jgi:predicted metal-dependent hydrolase
VVKEQERIYNEQKKMNPVQMRLNDRDTVESETCFDLLKKKKNSYKHARRYQQMLDADYPGNKILVTAF